MEKNILFILIFSFSVNFYAQEKEETITFVYEKSRYDSIAKLYVNKMIEANKLLKKKDKSYEELYIGSIDSLEIIINPIFDFKKDILKYKDKDNLLSYVDFKNNPEKQTFIVYNQGKFMYSFSPNGEWKQALEKNDLAFFEEWLKKNPFNLSSYEVVLSTTYALRNNFSFILKDTECVVINGNVFTFIDKYDVLTIGKFNSVFLENLHFFQKQILDTQVEKGEKSYSFSEYHPKYPLKKVRLNVIFN